VDGSTLGTRAHVSGGVLRAPVEVELRHDALRFPVVVNNRSAAETARRRTARTSARRLPRRRRRFAGDNNGVAGEDLAVLGLFVAILGAFGAAFQPRASLVAENLALRQQLAILRRRTKRPQLAPVDRAFWIVLSRVWSR
jgi:hypothetical protein